jgi:CNT family concentrative nucleoside transporter
MVVRACVALLVFLAVAWLLGENRRRVAWRTVLAGLVLQVVLGALLLKLPVFARAFVGLNQVVLALEESTVEGARTVFGYLSGGPLPYEETAPGSSFILAFRGLPLILVMSALSSLLFYWKVLPVVVRGMSWLLRRSMRLGGAEGLGVAANVFVGMVEAPLLIRPYVERLTRSELFSLMACGMATIAGTVMVLYASVLGDAIPNALGHILTASIISAPASIAIAKLMIPETSPPTSGHLDTGIEARSSMDAITKGTLQGVQLVLSVIAMILVLVALVHLINVILGVLPDARGAPLTLQRMLGWVMAPVVWLLGVPWSEAAQAGSLMGTKTIVNEFVAYLDLAALPEGTLCERTRLIMMYAMCGFANPGSVGIMIGGLGTMAPARRDEIVALGLRSIVAGTLATLMTGAVVGIFLG